MKLILTLLVTLCFSLAVAQKTKIYQDRECRCWKLENGNGNGEGEVYSGAKNDDGDYSRAIFTNAWFCSEANFIESRFDSVANFYDSRFDSETYFRNARFGSLAYFRRAQFGAPAYFGEARFDSRSDFGEARFDSVAIFNDALFNSVAYFREARFGALAYFGGSRFGLRADFWGARFHSQADFWESRFNSVANFNAARFDSLAYFDEARFDSKANFVHARFDGTVSFNKTILPDTLNFRDVKDIASEIDFTHSVLDSGKTVCYINLVGANIEKIKLDYGTFRLYWTDASHEEKRNTYERLLRKFQLDGFLESFQLLSIEYKVYNYTVKAARSNPIYWQLMNRLDKYWWNYGYNKELIFRNTLIIFFLFAIINLLSFKYINENVYKLETIWKKYREYKGKTPFLNKLYCSLTYTGVIFFGVKFSFEMIRHKNVLAVGYFYLQYVLGLVCLAYLFNFVISN